MKLISPTIQVKSGCWLDVDAVEWKILRTLARLVYLLCGLEQRWARCCRLALSTRQRIHEGWTTGAPNGTHFTQSEREWFNSSTPEEWFITIVLPYYEGKPGIKILIGDNLGSHFSAKIVKDAIKHNIIFVMLPTNSTHIFQPLDVVIFGPMKKVWRKVLDGWKKETRRSGPFPKEVFPILLNKLWVIMEDTFPSYLTSGFRTCGLYPLNQDEILKKLPQKPNGCDPRQILNDAVIRMLEIQRKPEAPQRKRGKVLQKYNAGAALREEEFMSDDEGNPFANIDATAGDDVNVDNQSESSTTSYSGSDLDNTIWANNSKCYICEKRTTTVATTGCNLKYRHLCLQNCGITGNCIFCDEDDSMFVVL